jgi:hypothetical protein
MLHAMNAQYRICYTILILFLTITVPRLAAQSDFWEPCEGPEGADIRDFTTTPDGSVYAFGNATFRSTDSGLTWIKTSDLGGN